jgi:hypothetical protein
MNRLILLVAFELLTSMTTQAALSPSFRTDIASSSVEGKSSVWIAESEKCDFMESLERAHADANQVCKDHYGDLSGEESFIIVKEWEAFPPYCDQGGQCGRKHECIIEWKATCN